MQGHSLSPILKDPSDSVRNFVLIEEDFPMTAFGPGPPIKNRTLISELGRYTRDSQGQQQLFDLASDPDELIDLSERQRDPQRKAAVVEQLVDALIESDDLCRSEPTVFNEETT